jgi:hypothetical protein
MILVAIPGSMSSVEAQVPIGLGFVDHEWHESNA